MLKQLSVCLAECKMLHWAVLNFFTPNDTPTEQPNTSNNLSTRIRFCITYRKKPVHFTKIEICRYLTHVCVLEY